MSVKETLDLQYPITNNGEECNQLCIRRPSVRDLLVSERAKGNEIEKEIRLIANLCEVAPEQIEQLDMADYMKLQETLTSFLSLNPGN